MDTKEQLKLITREIEEKNYQQNLLSSVESELVSLNNNIKNCIALISSSVKGKKATEIINNLTAENKKITDQCNITISEDKEKLKAHLKELNENQLLLQEKIRKEEEEKKKEEKS